MTSKPLYMYSLRDPYLWPLFYVHVMCRRHIYVPLNTQLFLAKSFKIVVSILLSDGNISDLYYFSHLLCKFVHYLVNSSYDPIAFTMRFVNEIGFPHAYSDSVQTCWIPQSRTYSMTLFSLCVCWAVICVGRWSALCGGLSHHSA